MVPHVLRATPWLVLGVAAALVTVLLRVVEEQPYVMWPLQGIAVGLVAGTAAWAYDEPAAAIVDTLPRSLAWRTTARSLAVAALVGWWLLSVLWTSAAYSGHAGHVAGQGVGAVLGVMAWSTWRRRRAVATPAQSISTVVVAMAAFLALTRPLGNRLPLFPYAAGNDVWSRSGWFWAAVALAASVGLAGILAERSFSDWVRPWPQGRSASRRASAAPTASGSTGWGTPGSGCRG